MKLIFGILILETTLGYASCPSEDDLNQEVRTVVYGEKIINNEGLFDEFDSHVFLENEDGFELIAVKSYSSSIFEEINLVNADNNEYVDIDYSIQFIESQSKLILNIKTQNESIELIETVEGIVTFNEADEVDVLFANEEQVLWLSDFLEDGVD
ncbi:MAG TPA: hypothetical protein PKC96_01330 [Bacilli bacterium]|nr:hypothetical protein [Bacilli bacterium]